MREIQDADIDGSERHIGILAGDEAADPHWNGQAAARLHLRGQIERDIQLALVLVDAEPGEAERAAGHALGGLVERAMRNGDGIGAAAPVGTDR